MLKYFSLRQPASLGPAVQGEAGEAREARAAWGCGPGLSEKVSRRAILDRSRGEQAPEPRVDRDEEEADVWYSTSKLFMDHINEVQSKWESIEDDIWAKIIVMERNRRVAKAYVRSPVISVSGGKEGFDGFRIGLVGFENPCRDPETARVKRQIGGQACRMRIDDDGNVEIKRTGKTEVYVSPASESGDRRQADRTLAGAARAEDKLLEVDRTLALFRMDTFQRSLAAGLRAGQAGRARRELELQCLSTVTLVRESPLLLDQPCWLLVINLVTLDQLRTKLSNPGPVLTLHPQRADIRQRPRLSLPYEATPGRVPSRVPRGESQTVDRRRREKPHPNSLYYSGLQARIPPFVQQGHQGLSSRSFSGPGRHAPGPTPLGQLEDIDESESDYSQIDEAAFGTGKRPTARGSLWH